MGDPLDFVDEGGWPYPDESPDSRWPEPVDVRAVPDDDMVALHALTPRALGALSAVELAAVTARFGLDGRAPLTMPELGRVLGLSRARTRATLAASLGKLRTALGDGPAGPSSGA
jgi:hypothetical protein